MEKELIELFEAAKKAADSAASLDGPAAEEARCLDALKTLKGFPVNYQILASTQVGKRLRNLTKHPKKKIQGLASDLLQLWKSIVLEETKNKENGSLTTDKSTGVDAANKDTGKANKIRKVASMKVDEVSVAETVTVKTLVAEKVEHVSRVKIEKIDSAKACNVQKVSTEQKKPSTVPTAPPRQMSIVKCNDALRDKIRELLLEALCKVSGEADDDVRDEVNACDPVRVSVAAETSLFEKWGRSNGSQKHKYRSVMFNIKDINNPDFRRKVLLGHVKPQELPNLSPEEMASDQRQLQNKQIKEKAMFECERGMQAKATTDQFKCGRCGQRKCTYYQMQTRSADEPMTTYVTCVNCNNHWKFC